MSGDVQPRKRKDKRRRKDELSVEEPRGTAAVLGEGDVFMHSYHDHGTGGHWCAKVIFFSLLAVLVTLIGLIILENRGLSELEANSVESKYSGVLEGWIEDAPDDDHHDEHTLELKHHDEDDEEDDEHQSLIDEDHDNDEDEEVDDANGDSDDDDNDLAEDGNDEIDDVNEDNEDDENEDENDSQEDDDNEERDQDDADEDQNLNSAENEEDEDENDYRKYYERLEKQQDDNDDDDGKEEDDEEDDDFGDNFNDNDEIDNDDAGLEHDSNEENMFEDNEENDNNQQIDDNDDDDDDEEEEDDDQRDEDSYEHGESHTTRRNEEEGDEEDEEEDAEVEVEKIEKEVSDEEVLEEAATSAAEEDEKSGEYSEEETPDEDQTVDEEDQTDDEEEFLEPDDIEEPPVVERITAPPGKPLPEVEEETSSEKPQDTLAEEEEYERQQEELRRQQEQASHLWLKVAVGGALLVATHAVVRRATAPRDASSDDEHISREETPSAIDRRMTLIAEEPIIGTDEPEETIQATVEKELEKIATLGSKSVPLSSEKSEEEEEEVDIETKNVETAEPENDDEDKELYSDEEEVEEEIEPEILQETKETPKQSAPAQLAPKEAAKDAEQDEEVPEDVEIIDDEQLEEELAEEEEEDEEEISDVDDAELLSRLEAKYGRLPEPERPGPKKDGGNSLEDEWPGEPSDQYWRQQLDEAEAELRQGAWDAAARGAGAEQLRASARARYIRARALDAAAEARRDNRLLTQSIAAYLELLKMNERLSDKKLLEVSNRTLDRIRFRGNYMNAEPVYRMLIRRFPDDPSHRNNLSITFLMANRPDLAEQVLKETLLRWPDDRIALAHLGFVLKTSHNKLEEAVDAMRKALEGDIGAANEPRFYFHLGDALLMLGRLDEAHEVHKRGAALGHFLSPAQRSLYNVDRLKSRPWWDIEQTPYQKLAHALQASWKSILKEGEAARALYEKEKEGLKERGEWSQLDLFVRGQELPGRCNKAPVTCSIVRQEIAAAGCKRGQIKFSAMEAGTHVRPHVGPTNCRLRIHLGLSNTKDTYIRVDKETRQWQTGKVLMFDDSFEHEVWHNGTGTRLVLIVDVWHPDLTPTERRQLPAI